MALSMTKAAKAQRKRARQEKRALYDPNVQLSGGALRRGARSITNYEYGPQIKAKRSEIAGLGVLGQQTDQRVSAAYMQLAKEVQSQLDQQKAISQRLSDQTATRNQEAADASKQLGDYSNQVMAQQGGIPGGGRSILGDTVAAEQQRQQNLSRAYQDQADTSAANYGLLGSNMAAAYQQQGTQARTDIAKAIANRVAGAQSDLSSIRANRSNAFVKNLLDLRTGEQNYGLAAGKLQATIDQNAATNALAQQKLGVTKRELMMKLASAHSTQALNRAKADVIRYNLAHPNSPLTASGSKGKLKAPAPTPAGRANRTKWEQYLGYARQYGDFQTANAVAGGQGGLDPTLYKIANKIAKHKRISKHEVYILNNRYPGVTDVRLGASPNLNKGY